ncbi:uncharacterized protein CANTADRAFT_26241 [Suhomyces tanzawaensis NRRL Y-17324]|uniref:Uncharacterized protein n=1 Tax=Suhomyces tanzawaensis NRRL Y-17324 TaxID=984487 RepID=A0A1E4SIB5_9ASCO|nr:uncharacterized protein CANTADRAFT_26241 [Suhomyces tanzawaensis NRRL Y-17324]ODV79258.1 hypothetical protein CANTADRAFT_26241 [Suhomyces tanzawaensis NRRL Y-17324]
MAIDGATTNPMRWSTDALSSNEPMMKDPEIMDTLDIESNIAGQIGTSKEVDLERTVHKDAVPQDAEMKDPPMVNGQNSVSGPGDVSMAQFDMISSNISDTICKMTEIYNQVGFSESEISVKKSEIFIVISETIANFTSKLQREKCTIENECEWLRQHIKIILAMINDSNGELTLSSLDRGVVFVNQQLYEEGYTHQLREKQANRSNTFYNTSPFNIESSSSDGEQEEYQDPNRKIPKLSLLQIKSKLNCIFLEVLRAFVVPFKRLVLSASTYKEQLDIIGEMYSSNPNLALIKDLPDREELELYSNLIDNFEITLKSLKLEKGVDQFMHVNGGRDHTFIISSPRKLRNNHTEEINPATHETPTRIQSQQDDPLIVLKDINYQLIRAIRSLKYTKITDDIIHSIRCEIDFCNKEISKRSEQVIKIIESCLSNIKLLCLTNDQIIEIQKQYDISTTSESISNEGYFDIDTLTFIKQDPKNFGLKEEHINYLNRFCNILNRKKDNKQKKYDTYVKSCTELWKKFDEKTEYVEQFLAANNSLSDVSILNFKIELNQLIIKRSKYIEKFIYDSRKEIETYWDNMFYTTEERKAFKFYENSYKDQDQVDIDINQSGINDDKELILLEHEQELEKLKLEYSEKEKILQLNNQLQALLKDQEFLRESSKDSSRLLSKNSCKILLNEEKLRKKIHKQLPRVIDSLKNEIRVYNLERNTLLKINGTDFYQRVSSIETEVLSKSRSARAKPGLVAQSSPTKLGNRVNKASPVKVTKSPFTSSIQRSAPIGTQRSSQISPQPAKQRPFLSRSNNKINPTAIKLTNVFSGSIASNSTVTSLESPIRFNSASTRDRMMTHLQPLNNPLVPQEFKSTHIYDDNDTLKISTFNRSKVSPLGVNNPNRMNSARSPGIGNQSSPKHGYEKENFSFDVSSAKIQEKSNQISSSRRLSIGTCDSSTLIGDDYQTWRDEQIKQFNV